jgi:hypothetical protein
MSDFADAGAGDPVVLDSADEVSAHKGEGIVFQAGRLPWPMLAVALLCALTLRMVASVAVNAFYWGKFTADTQGQRLGDTLVNIGGFGDGEGAALLLAATGLLLFTDWESPADGRMRVIYWYWLEALFAASVGGAILVIVGNSFYYSHLRGSRADLAFTLGTGGFSLSYAVIGMAGTLACHWRILDNARRGSTPMGEVESEGANPYGDIL